MTLSLRQHQLTDLLTTYPEPMPDLTENRVDDLAVYVEPFHILIERINHESRIVLRRHLLCCKSRSLCKKATIDFYITLHGGWHERLYGEGLPSYWRFVFSPAPSVGHSCLRLADEGWAHSTEYLCSFACGEILLILQNLLRIHQVESKLRGADIRHKIHSEPS